MSKVIREKNHHQYTTAITSQQNAAELRDGARQLYVAARAAVSQAGYLEQ